MLYFDMNFKVLSVSDEEYKIKSDTYYKCSILCFFNVHLDAYIRSEVIDKVTKGGYYKSVKTYLTSNYFDVMYTEKGSSLEEVPLYFRGFMVVIEDLEEGSVREFNRRRQPTVKVNGAICKGETSVIKKSGKFDTPTIRFRLNIQNEYQELFYLNALACYKSAKIIANLDNMTYADFEGILIVSKFNGYPSLMVTDLKTITQEEEI